MIKESCNMIGQKHSGRFKFLFPRYEVCTGIIKSFILNYFQLKIISNLPKTLKNAIFGPFRPF